MAFCPLQRAEGLQGACPGWRGHSSGGERRRLILLRQTKLFLWKETLGPSAPRGFEGGGRRPRGPGSGGPALGSILCCPPLESPGGVRAKADVSVSRWPRACPWGCGREVRGRHTISSCRMRSRRRGCHRSVPLPGPRARIPTPSGNGLGVSLQDPPPHLNPRGLGGESPLPASQGGRVTRAWPTSLVHPLGLRAWFRDENVSQTGMTRVRPAEQVGRKILTFQQTEMRKGERPGPPEPPGEGDGETAGPSPALRPAVPGPFQAHRVVRLKSVESGFATPTTERAQSNMLSPSCSEGCGHTEAESALGSPTPHPGLEESSKAGQGDALGGGPACGPGGRAPTWGTSKMQRPRPTPER